MAVTAEYVASCTVGAAMVTAIFDGSGRSSILGPPLCRARSGDARSTPTSKTRSSWATTSPMSASARPRSCSISASTSPPRHRRGVRPATSGRRGGAAHAALGVRPEEITRVLITHARGDHVAGGAVERAVGAALPQRDLFPGPCRLGGESRARPARFAPGAAPRAGRRSGPTRTGRHRATSSPVSRCSLPPTSRPAIASSTSPPRARPSPSWAISSASQARYNTATGRRAGATWRRCSPRARRCSRWRCPPMRCW